jgi:hypothetical protein
MRYLGCFLFSAIMLTCGSLHVQADYKEDIGYAALQAELGGTPDGSGTAATQVEACVDAGGVQAWMPDPDDPEFSGKTIHDKSGSPAVYSGHATAVGRRFYGNSLSIAPGVDTIDSYEAADWMGSGFLWGSSSYQPYYSTSRVANHSWVGSAGGFDSEILRRTDWVVETDEFIQAAAFSTGSPLLGSAFNVIAVGRTSGESGSGSVPVDDIYTGGRARPDIVAPLSSLSAATPVAAASSVLLAEVGHGDPSLSSDPNEPWTTDRNGETVFNAERSESIKAALMAGADRVTDNAADPNIMDYRTSPSNRAANGLDRRYGAGQINIYNAYQIIAAGEQNSLEDDPAGKGNIGRYGFDYDPSFGGLDGASNYEASYFFTADDNAARLYASLVWNIDIDGGTWFSFDGSAVLYDMGLFLYDVTDTGDHLLMAVSTATGENTENLWVPLVKGRDYLLQVKPGAGQTPFEWDYALAWRIATPGDADEDGMPDDWEVQWGLDAQNPGDAWQDPDSDGLTNLEERGHATSPVDPDTDADGVSDGGEIDAGTDPLNPLSYSHAVPAASFPGLLLALLFVLIFGAMKRKTTPPGK